jgi:hypothetical protein
MRASGAWGFVEDFLNGRSVDGEASAKAAGPWRERLHLSSYFKESFDPSFFEPG